MSARHPVSRCFGIDRGTPIDRYYIDTFLRQQAADIHGSTLEIGDDSYIRRFGQRVRRADVLHVRDGNPKATIIGDLTTGAGIPEGAFDCILCTQTLMFIYDTPAVVATLYRALKPGGVALVTAAGISHIAGFDMRAWGDYWRFTSMSLARLFREVFGPEHVQVHAWGNSFAAVGLLQGMTVEEMQPDELDRLDVDYELIVSARAVKADVVR